MFLHDKLDLDKPPIIQKYCCHKMPNQNIFFFFFVLHYVQQLDENVPFEFWDLKKL
jgi:hypothetical protein